MNSDEKERDDERKKRHDPARLLDNHMLRTEAEIDRKLTFVRDEYFRMSAEERAELQKCVQLSAKGGRPKIRPTNVSIGVTLSFQRGDGCDEIEVSAYQLNHAIKAWSRGKGYFHSAWKESVR